MATSMEHLEEAEHFLNDPGVPSEHRAVNCLDELLKWAKLVEKAIEKPAPCDASDLESARDYLLIGDDHDAIKDILNWAFAHEDSHE